MLIVAIIVGVVLLGGFLYLLAKVLKALGEWGSDGGA